MIEPAVDLAQVAHAQGLVGLGPISRLRQLTDAMAQAIRTVEAGSPTVVDVVVKPGYQS